MFIGCCRCLLCCKCFRSESKDDAAARDQFIRGGAGGPAAQVLRLVGQSWAQEGWSLGTAGRIWQPAACLQQHVALAAGERLARVSAAWSGAPQRRTAGAPARFPCRYGAPAAWLSHCVFNPPSLFPAGLQYGLTNPAKGARQGGCLTWGTAFWALFVGISLAVVGGEWRWAALPGLHPPLLRRPRAHEDSAASAPHNRPCHALRRLSRSAVPPRLPRRLQCLPGAWPARSTSPTRLSVTFGLWWTARRGG